MSDQVVIVALKCPNCGSSLNIAPEMTAFACGYCGANIVVRREGGTVSVALEHAIAKVQRGTDKTAAELAIARLKADLRDLEAMAVHPDDMAEATQLRAELTKRYAHLHQKVTGVTAALLIPLIPVVFVCGQMNPNVFVSLAIIVIWMVCSVSIARRIFGSTFNEYEAERQTLSYKVVEKKNARITAVKQRIDEAEAIANS